MKCDLSYKNSQNQGKLLIYTPKLDMFMTIKQSLT